MRTYTYTVIYLFSLLLNPILVTSRHFVLISAPGSGKGTFSQYMAKKYDYVHIGLGDILRTRIDRHKSIESKTVNKIMQKHILKALKNNKSFIFDNAITSKKSWELWKEFFKEYNLIDDIYFIVLEASDTTCISRIKDRLICKKCFNVCKKRKNIPSQDQTCSECGNNLSIRKEDHDHSFLMKRFESYHRQINPIINTIEKSYSVIKISSEQPLAHLYKIYDELHNS